MHRSSGARQALPLSALGAVAAVAAAGLAYVLSQRRRRPALSEEEWQQALLECGTIAGFDGIVQEVLDRGIDPIIRADVWPFLLEVFDHASTFAQRQQQHQLMTKQYQQLLLQCQAYEAVIKESLRPHSPPSARQDTPCGTLQQQQQLHSQGGGGLSHSSSTGGSRSPRSAGLSPSQQQQQLPEQVRQFAEAHRVIVMDAVRTDFQKHAAALQQAQGCCDAAAADAPGSHHVAAAPHAPDHTFPGADGAAGVGVAAVAASLVNQGLHTLSTLQAWQQYWLCNLLGGQAAAWGHNQALWVSEAAQLVLDTSGHLPADSKRQASRMIAMLSAYALHDPDTGYCQGMSDLLLPFLLLMDDDALVFWCFVALMQHLGARGNFAVDERGIFGQLRRLAQVLEDNDRPLMYRLHQLGAADCHFAYRMVVVMMRRDMPVPKVMQLWEVLWAFSWQRRRQQQQQQQAGVDDSRGGSLKHQQALDEDEPDAVVHAGAPSGKGGSGGEGSRASAGEPPHVQLFICFVAAVIMAQRRTVLDQCRDADDILRLCHSLKHVDFWGSLSYAQLLHQGQTNSLNQPHHQCHQLEQPRAGTAGK